jgi:hypothetical protein
MALFNALAILDDMAQVDRTSISAIFAKCDVDLEIIIVGSTASEAQKTAVTSAELLVIILTPGISMNVAINALITLASDSNVRIVGVRIGSSDEWPTALDEFADAVVPIEGDKLCAALNGRFDGWIDATGSVRAKRAIKKANC